MSSIDEILSLCESRIGYQFRDRTLLRRCLTHSSSAETRLDSNERLEFLGDAVLGLIICEHLFRLYPQQREGQLTQMKSCLVSRQTCARVARLLELQNLILVGRGLQTIPDSILSAVIESLIAGVYFDGGLDAAREFILFGFREELALCGPVDTENYKSQLQEHTQRELGKTPEYIVVEETGPDHAREFGVAARVGVTVFDIGRGRSKKEAEQQAARNAVMSLLQAKSLETLQTQSDVTLKTDGDAGEFVSIVAADPGEQLSSVDAAGVTDGSVVGEGIGTIDCAPDRGSEIELKIMRQTIHISSAGSDDSVASTKDSQSVNTSKETTNETQNASISLCNKSRISCDPSPLKARVMKTVEAEILFRPESAGLRFLPEGPYCLDENRLSWVGIQHGPDSTTGSINVLDLSTGTNLSYELPGRPGFAFPTNRPGVFVTGVERSVGLFDTNSGVWSPFIENVDSDVSNTIINDAVVFDGHLIFGCKELEFKTKKAGLYLWRRTDGATIRLRNDQICSNGKAVIREVDGGLTLFDIDSPSKQIVRSRLSIADGTVGEPQVVVDLTAEDVFPDGMILTPDHRSLIVALYDPGDPTAGAARQYSLADGTLEAVWTCPASPRVTCPQLIRHHGRIRLALTSAVEHMSAAQSQQHTAAGCLFVADTNFTATGDQPVFDCP